MKKLTMGIAFLWLFLFSYSIASASTIPKQIGDVYVQDHANMIDSNTERQLIEMGKMLDQKTKAQIGVVTVETTEGVDIAEYAVDAFRYYGFGDKEKNNGIMLIISKKEKQLRIEVGYGLEGVINDGKAGGILDTTTIPKMKEGKVSLAVYETYKVLVNDVQQYYKDGSVSQSDSSESKIPWVKIILIIIILIIAIILDIYIFGGWLTYLILSLLQNGISSIFGGGGSSGGGGSDRDF